VVEDIVAVPEAVIAEVVPEEDIAEEAVVAEEGNTEINHQHKREAARKNEGVQNIEPLRFS
jgi:hypothetical protein